VGGQIEIQPAGGEGRGDGVLGCQQGLKAVYGHSDSESSDNEHRKVLHVMFGGSWDITFRRIVKTLC
jgi:hypothetical protein